MPKDQIKLPQEIDLYIPYTNKIIKLVKKLNNEILNKAESLFNEEKYFQSVIILLLHFSFFCYLYNFYRIILENNLIKFKIKYLQLFIFFRILKINVSF